MRRETWEGDLARFIKARASMPFAWGSHDCVMFAVGCAEAMTGVDLAAKYRGTYDTAEGAKRIIDDAGGLRSLVAENVGSEIPPAMARRGDWIMIDQGTGPALAICIGDRILAAGRDGLVSCPMSEAITAWRIV